MPLKSLLDVGHDRAANIVRLPMRFSSDSDLALAAIERHPAAAAAIWDRFAGLLRGLFRRTLGTADVDDHVQETLLRFFDAVKRLREPNKLSSFIIGIAVRVAREELRARKMRRMLRLATRRDRSVSTDFTAAEALARLYELLDRVDGDTRVIFVLRFVEQMPTAEIAEVLDVSLATAKRRVKRAREHIEKRAIRDPALAGYIRGAAHGEKHVG